MYGDNLAQVMGPVISATVSVLGCVSTDCVVIQPAVLSLRTRIQDTQIYLETYRYEKLKSELRRKSAIG